jgi:zinc protease
VSRPGRRAALALALALGLGCANPLVRRPAWELAPPPAHEAPVVQAGALHRSELPNGLRVIALEDHRLPRISFGVTLRRGAASERLERAGLALFMAELMERGAGDRDALALAQAVDQLGASLSVTSGWDATTVGVAGLSRDVDALFGILGDVVLRPRFDAREATRAREEMLASLEQAKDDPETLAARNLARALYPGHRYGLPREGSPETVKGFDAAAARALHARLFVPNDAILWVAGDFELERFLARAVEVFGPWPRGTVVDAGPPPPQPAPAARRVVIVDRPDLEQARIAFGHEGIARTDPDRVAVSLMNDLLGGGGFSSRLMDALRAEAGLTYAVGSGFSLRRERGPFHVSTFTRVPEARRTLDLALAEIERFRREPPDEAELQDARALAVGEFSLGLETSDAVVASLVDLDVHGLPEDSLDTYRARVRATTPAQVAALVERLLHPERAAIVLVGPAEALRPQLEGLGPIQVVAP